ncbi:hypothetical protein OUQ99_00520 [Streptomonospora nanhaiensis]|uniref:Clp R domain-containing protein n=1 Tax=Streptomonospora nanhaiensis TaxID=1323731 RepID=A0ABY6YPB7_9ACTN|nr:Clp protease N-terminal domain-containing protein [Streptomonospora nanhaiensis]WAE73655.1 hypothetical protein OUQ99_00520 [Streptomonospora nanhaiensis]
MSDPGALTMFERFTEQAKDVTVLAREEAMELRRNHIGTEHLLLGLLHEDHGAALPVLRGLDVSPELVREQVHGVWAHLSKQIQEQAHGQAD